MCFFPPIFLQCSSFFLPFLPLSCMFPWFSTFFGDFCRIPSLWEKLTLFTGFARKTIGFLHWSSANVTTSFHFFVSCFCGIVSLSDGLFDCLISYKSYIYSTRSTQSLHHLVAGFCFCLLLFLSLLWSCGVRNVITLIIWSWKGGGGRGCASQMHNHLCFLCCCFCCCFSSSCFCSCSCFSCSRSCWPYYARSLPNHCSVDSAWIWAYVCWCPSLWFCCHRQNTQKKQTSPLQTCMWSKN